jgi:glucosyl-3-phosphoglycerate synthase
VSAAQEQARAATPVSEWFAARSFEHAEFANLGRLARRKRELGVSVSVVLPCKEVAGTVGEIAGRIAALNERAPLVDQALAVDAGSADGTAEVARRHGLEVYQEDELVRGLGPAAGKGDALWRALEVARGDLVLYLDSDTTNFGPQFVYGMLGPLLSRPGVRFVKGAYRRPFTAPDGTVLDDSGRVTELTAKPLFAVFYPELAGFGQPLAGEIAAERSLLETIPYCTGYAVETAMMIDVLRVAGLEAMAQVDLGTRANRSQPLLALGTMAYEVVRAVVMRLSRDGRLTRVREEEEREDALTALDAYVRAVCMAGGTRLEGRLVEVVERPPMGELRAGRG